MWALICIPFAQFSSTLRSVGDSLPACASHLVTAWQLVVFEELGRLVGKSLASFVNRDMKQLQERYRQNPKLSQNSILDVYEGSIEAPPAVKASPGGMNELLNILHMKIEMSK